jgi:hypothetical protein
MDIRPMKHNILRPHHNTLFQFASLLSLSLALAEPSARASLGGYDSAIAADAGSGLTPLARLTNAAVLTGANRAAFNFGANSGDVTMEFILEGNPNFSAGSAYLAVGANTSSNLRYEQWNNTGQLGFTQLGVADYLFSPTVPSPNIPVHIAYVWQAASRTMRLYLNGSLAGSSSGVSTAFAMPTGTGWLGANPGLGETMAGTIHRVTVYDDIIPDAAIQRHADAYNDVVRPPVVLSFTANPPAIFAPDSTTLSWSVENFTGLLLDGADVTSLASLIVSPTVTTTYTLLATNAAASATNRLTVVVDPPPVIHSFIANRRHVAAGTSVTLSWSSDYGSAFSIAPAPGDVTAQTVGGAGSVVINPSADTTYTLTVTSAFGAAASNVIVEIVNTASHLVISEFMADNETTLADDDGDFSDWIEIHNPTAGAIGLAGHFLTDEKSDPTKWAFPNISIPAGGYLIVWASEKNRINPTAPLHTSFQLDQAGEYLALIGPGPAVLHEFDPFPAQFDDASYGLLGGDLSIVQFMGEPTPGAENIDSPPPPAPVEFSRESGMFTDAFALTLTCSTPGAEIRYTINGSTPDTTNGLVYSTPIAFSGTRRVRAVALANGRSSRLSGESYIKLSASLANYTSTLPIMIIENFGSGIIPQKGWSGTGAGIRQFPRQNAVWATFERETGVSSLTNAPEMWSTIGIRGRGAFSSTWRQKPYSVEVIDESGGERKVSPLGMPAHADWVLYFPDPDSNKDPSLFFNTFAYQLYRDIGHADGVRFRWVEAFINEDGGDLQLTDRRGVYAIMEKVSRGNDRLNFTRLSEDGSTGSWLLNLNRMDPEPETGWPAANGTTQPQFFHTAGPNRILQTPPNAQVVGDDEPQQSNGYLNFDNPSGYEINSSQRAAIEEWFRQFEDVLWNNALWRDPTNGYRKYLDSVDFADYFILNTLTHNGDGLLISMFPWKGDDGKLRMGPAWDYNWSAYYIGLPAMTGDLYWRSTTLWYRRLFTDPDFTQLYIDRWWDHRRSAMSNAGMDANIDAQMNDISPAKAVLNGLSSATDWTNRLATMKTWLRTRADWIDSNYIRPPFFNQDGGAVPDGFQITILGTNGTIYFTIDGSDPRAPGGAVAGAAQAFQLPFPITAQTFVQARIRIGTNWSGLTRAVFYPPQDLSKLAVTEIMFNPPDRGVTVGDEFEFLELKNTGTNTLQLGTLTFTAGLTFTFTNGTRLGPGQFFVLARNAAAFASKYPGVAVSGIFSGRLDNAGETIRLSTPFGTTIFSVTYNDRAPWPLASDGHGFSLVPKNTAASLNSDDGSAWRASTVMGGSPGADDPAPTVAPVLVNEVMTHTDLPETDWIELFNPNATAVDIGGWFLSDDAPAPKKFRIPDGTVMAAGGYRVFTEAEFNGEPGSLTSFSLSSAGDSIYLSSGDTTTDLTGYSHGFTFGAAANGVTFGRYVNSVDEEQFPAQISATREATNSGPRVGPAVLSEIHYHPEAGGDEFIELRNITGDDLNLFDPAHPTNTWRINGLGFTFPPNVTLPADGVLLVVSIPPASFRMKYAIPEPVPILGPFAGVLQDGGERLELQRPDVPGTNGLPYITVDEVRYNDRAPWPPAADGSGASLQRKDLSAYGNDPIHWAAAIPTPGAELVIGLAPVITLQPQGLAILSFQSAQFTVSATGTTPLFYQWLFNGAPIPGGTNATLSLVNVQPGQAGDYHAVVFNHAGSDASATARLIVNRVPTILAPPTNTFSRISSNTIFTVTAVGNGLLRYQWRFNGVNISGATNASMVITNTQPTNAGVYSVTVTDSIGSIETPPVTLAMLINPTILIGPISQSVVVGQPVTLSVVANGSPLPFNYDWRRGSINVASNNANAFTDFYSFIASSTVGTQLYRVVVRNLAHSGVNANAACNIITLADADGDGVADIWETAHGLNTNSLTDAAFDTDGDSMSNRAEFLAGTDPTNPSSYLKIGSITAGGGATLTFGAISNRTYSVQHSDIVGSGLWFKVADIVARTTNRVESITDPTFTTNRVYRLATPQQQ